MTKQIKILLVDDDLFMLDYLTNLLNDAGFHSIKSAFTIDSALTMGQTFKPNLLITDININSSEDGITLAKEFQKKHNSTIVFISGDTEALNAIEDLTPLLILSKPVFNSDIQILIDVLRKII